MSFSSRRSRRPIPAGPFRVPEGEVRQQANYHVFALCFVVFLLLSVGLLNLYSASIGNTYFNSQIRNTIPALVVFAVIGWLVPMRFIKNYTYVFFALIVLMLLAVLFAGHVAGGSQRWMNILGIKVQPSEFAKVSCALVVARFFLNNRMVNAYTLRDLWPLLGLIGLIFLLVFEQPDLGTAGICVLIACSQLAFVRIDRRSIAYVFGSFSMGALLGWFVFLRDYQKLRIINLFNPEFDPQGSGYHSLQSLVAVGSGGFFGKGFLAGTQTQLQFLPERHTDFIFSVFSEEHGFLGAGFVFLCFSALTYLALDIARQAKDTFSSLLAVGISALLFIEFVINVSMVLGIFPVVGVPLPFFSHGGSAMLTVFTSIGILIAIQRDTRLRDNDHENTIQALRAIQTK